MTTEASKIPKQIFQLALLLLRSAFFPEIPCVLRKRGLIGESQNAVAAYVIGTSSLRAKPLNLLVKGQSSSGKNFFCDCVLSLYPKERVYVLSSASGKSWNYLGQKLSHSIVYVQELNATTGPTHPARLLMSEGNLIHRVTERRRGRFVTTEYVTEGPVACISTTTSDRIKVDDERRAYSIWIDESSEQTRRILRAEVERDDQIALSDDELLVWHAVQQIVSKRAAWPIKRPNWLRIVADEVRVDDVSVRRYFPAFLHACEIVCLLRSYQRKDQEKLRDEQTLSINFVDYATTWLIFDPIVAQSFGRTDDHDMETVQQIEKISTENGGKPVQARDLAQAMAISDDQAYNRIRRAQERGLVQRANAPAKTNLKLYLPSPVTRFAPDPLSVFQRLNKREEVQFVHPLTGKIVTYRRSETPSEVQDA